MHPGALPGDDEGLSRRESALGPRCATDQRQYPVMTPSWKNSQICLGLLLLLCSNLCGKGTS